MNTTTLVSLRLDHDPVATSIEMYLQHEAARRRMQLKLREYAQGVTVAFEHVTAHGETFEIAFIRFARLLLDDERYRDGLMQCLKGMVEEAT